MKIRLTLTISFCLSFLVFFSQLGRVSGRILDGNSKDPMAYVTVSVLKKTDSSLLNGSVTNVDGFFKIQNLDIGQQYLIKYSFIGYKYHFQAIDFKGAQNLSLNDVVMFSDNNLLKNVEVLADDPIITYEIDKKVVNVESMNTVVSQTAVEVLANIPSISVDMDGNVALRGSSGFTLLIDGRPSALPSSEALQLIQASNIKDIEIITNPSAKYDAEGTSGVINVILKRNKLEGISTLVNLNGGNSGNSTDFINAGGDFITSINTGDFKFNIGGQYVNRNRFRDIEQIRRTTIGGVESSIESQGLHRFFGKNYGGNFAMEYNPSKSDFFNVGVNITQRQWNAAANYFFEEFSGDSLLNSYENRERTLRDFFVISSSLGYQHLFNNDKNHYLSFSSTYNLYDGVEDAETEFFTLDSILLGGNRNTEVGPSNSLRLSLDYQYPFKNGVKFQLGARTDFGFSGDDQDAFEYDLVNSEYFRLDSFSTDVSYVQNIYAGYGIINGKIIDKLGYQLGLRAEYTDRLIELTDATFNTSIDRLDWFPSVHLSFSQNTKNQYKLSASKRINRPRSWHLEPFIAWEDPYTVRQGNPDLLPEYIQSYELGYIRQLRKGSFSSEIYFRNTNNIRERIQQVYDTNVIIKRPVNAGVSNALGLELAYNYKPFSWWILDFGTNLFYYQIIGKIAGSSLDQETFTYRGRLSNNFILKHNFKIQFITNYTADVVTVQGVDKGFVSFDLAIKKDFQEGKLSTTFQLRNLLNTERRETWADTQTLYSYRLASPKWPIFTFSLSVRLNNFNSKDKIQLEKGSEF